MLKLRTIHLYLGCVFAPLLLFFGISGIWQTLGLRLPWLRLLATIHTSRELKSGGGLSSLSLKIFVLLMTVGFLITTLLGVVLALKHGRSRRMVYGCLILGVVLPLGFILLRAFASGGR